MIFDSVPQNKYLGISGVFLASLVLYFQAYLDPVIWPVIGEELGLGHLYSLAIMMLTLVSAVMTPVAAKLGACYSHKTLLLIVTAVYIPVALCQFLIYDIGSLVIIRMLLGPAGAFIFTVSFLIIADLFSEKQRGLLVGISAGLMGFASILVPPLAGILIQILPVRLCFLFAPALMLPAFFLIYVFLPATPTEQSSEGFDIIGAILMLFAIGSLLLVLTLGGETIPWNHPSVYLGLAISVCTGIIFFLRERKIGSAALIPLFVFNTKKSILLICAAFFSGASATVVYYTLSFYMIAALGATSSEVGIVVGLQFLITLILAPWFGHHLGDFRLYRGFLWGSSVLMILIYLYLGFLLEPGFSPWLLYGAMILFGFYAMVISVIYLYLAENAISDALRPYVCGGIHFGVSLSYAVMLALVNIIFNIFGNDIVRGFSVVCVVSVVLVILTLILSDVSATSEADS